MKTMKRTEYRFNGRVVCVVDESLYNPECAFFRTTFDGLFTRCHVSDAHALAKAFLVQLRGATPSPGDL